MATADPALSYAHGASAQPLLGETIGWREPATRALRVPDAEALVVCHQGYRATYRQLWDRSRESRSG